MEYEYFYSVVLLLSLKYRIVILLPPMKWIRETKGQGRLSSLRNYNCRFNKQWLLQIKIILKIIYILFQIYYLANLSLFHLNGSVLVSHKITKFIIITIILIINHHSQTWLIQPEAQQQIWSSLSCEGVSVKLLVQS